MSEQSIYWKPKFYCTAFVLVTATCLLGFDLIGSGEWVTVTNLTLGTYVTGSVIENQVLKP